MFSMFKDKNILITGGTGSFGKKFVEMMLRNSKANKVIIFSRDELKQSQMAEQFKDKRIRFFIGDVRDKERLNRAFKSVDIVVHAAALKQVPALEYNPFEAIKTNIMGSQNVIDAAIDQGVHRVLLISTDKATNPINLYGATKLCAEKLFVAGNAYSGSGETKLSVLRYGNVLGSRGSLLDVIKKQKTEGVVKITDERMTRFWITLDQAVTFAIKVLNMMEGGEVFVPKIPSMKITDIFNIIAPDSKKEIVGIRPGEKLHEVLVCADEARNTEEIEEFYLIKSDVISKEWKNKGVKVQAEFVYSSNNNTKWLNESQLKSLMADNQ